VDKRNVSATFFAQKLQFYTERLLFRYLSITDRGFYDYASKHQLDGEIHRINAYLQSQEELYLRVGVGRQWKVGDRDGYWLQVNGIYTFPDYLEEVRTYGN
jgi:hypothetical protein